MILLKWQYKFVTCLLRVFIAINIQEKVDNPYNIKPLYDLANSNTFALSFYYLHANLVFLCNI